MTLEYGVSAAAVAKSWGEMVRVYGTPRIPVEFALWAVLVQ